MNNPLQPRRYLVRRLHDVESLNQTEIAERLQVSQATVQRDLSSTVAPAEKTEAGTPFYPPGRFEDDPEFQERVSKLSRDMPEPNARLQAAREFAGPPKRPAFGGQVDRIRTGEAQAALQAEAIGVVSR